MVIVLLLIEIAYSHERRSRYADTEQKAF